MLFASLALLSGYATDRCNEQVFGGLDGRLTATPIAKLPINGDTVLGFEIIREVPIAALPHRVIAGSRQDVLTWTSLDKVSHIAVVGNEKLLVQTTKGILTPHGKSLNAVNDLHKAVRGELFDSGNSNALSLTKEGGGTMDHHRHSPRCDRGIIFTASECSASTFVEPSWFEFDRR